MKVVLLLVLFFETISFSRAEIIADEGRKRKLASANGTHAVCSDHKSWQISHKVPYEETYIKGYWFRRTKIKVNYRTEYQTHILINYFCCHGYKEITGVCVPQCSTKCEFGYCYEPNFCACNEGYKISDSSKNVCEPMCSNECENGWCSKPNTCSCNNGYKMVDDGHICVPECGELCGEREVCVEPGKCECVWHYEKITDKNGSTNCEPICELPCLNGKCVAPNICECHEGYKKNAHDPSACDPVCDFCNFGICSAPGFCNCFKGYKSSSIFGSQLCEPECSNGCINGECVAPEQCSCYTGYNKSTNTTICKPICNETCINAECIEPNRCSCFKGFTHKENSTSECEPVCIEPCVNGNCVGPDSCECLPGYAQTENSSNICEPICDEMCVNGDCTAPNTCTCFEGYRPLNFAPSTCEPICNDTCKNGQCTAPEICTCNPGYEKTSENGTCEFFCDCENGFCIEPNSTCICNQGYEIVKTANLESCVPICNISCGNGTCVAPGICDCDEGFHVGNINDTESDYVCMSVCGPCANGICSFKDKSCFCDKGWKGKFCEEAEFCVLELERNSSWGERVQSIQNDSFHSHNFPNCSEDYLSLINISTDCYATIIDDTWNNTKFECILKLGTNFTMTKNIFPLSESFVNFDVQILGSCSVVSFIVIAIVAFIAVRATIRKRKALKQYAIMDIAMGHCSSDKNQ